MLFPHRRHCIRALYIPLLGLAWVLLLVACNGAAIPASAPARVTQQQQVDGLIITLETPVDPKVNQSQTFTITVTDTQGAAINDANVYLQLDMPAHPMANAQPIAELVGDGQYQTSSVYTMSGEWAVTVLAALDGAEHRTTFTVPVSE